MSRLRLIAPPDPPAPAEPARATPACVEFCGIETPIERTPFTIGRDGDVAVDDANLFLHRQFLVIERRGDVWTLANTGTQLSARVGDSAGRAESYLAPGGVVPLVAAATTVRFTAGPTTYELTVHVPDAAAFRPPRPGRNRAHHLRATDATMGRVTLSPEQFLVVLVLAEPLLVDGHHAAAVLPSNAAAAARLGWTVTKFNRKLDTVCAKLSECGVRGLHGGPVRLATTRRARLVEYAITTQLVTGRDLHLLPAKQADPVTRGG